MSLDLSVVIPVYNEIARIEKSLDTIHGYLTESKLNFEIIVVNDGSTDSTADLIRDIQTRIASVRLIDNPRNKGKGAVLRQGVLQARGDLILTSDADLSTPIGELEKLQTAIAAGCDIAIGSRALAQSQIGVSQPLYRVLFGKTFNLLVRLLYLPRIRDSQCGFKLFKLRIAHELFGQQLLAGIVFDVEILYLAQKKGYTIREVPIKWDNSPDSKFRATFSTGKQVILDLLAIRTLHEQAESNQA